MRDGLRAGGRLGVSVHGRNVPFFTSILDAVTEYIPDYVQPGTPELDRYSTEDALREEISNAEFSDVVVNGYTFGYSPGSFEQYWTDYLRYVAKPVKEKIASLGTVQRTELMEAVRSNTAPFTEGDGTIRFPWEVLILTAKR